MEADKFVEGSETSATVKEGFTHPRKFILILEEIINNCKLFLDIPCTRAVRISTVYNTHDAMIHNAQTPSNHLRVSIDISIEDDALLPIHVDEDIITVRLALGTFVARPEHLIDVVPIMGKVSTDHSATSPPRIYNEHAFKKAKVVKSKSRSSKLNLELPREVAPKKSNNLCEILWNHVQKISDDSTIMISLPLPIYGFSTDEFIGINEVKDVHGHDWIGASVISVCIRYLYDNFISKSKKKVMFLSPHSNTLVAVSNDTRKNEKKKYVAEILEKNKADLFLAPLNIP
ncbi:hypothetical protein Lal_00012586 [Lupinus albus]|nr:hypothetical protein Lal_00012586 [Lupinus albus]